ncbi:hypothetical protein EYD00_18950 [Agrobacterium sp. 33MFTa1.1]|uniref:hypothetical protein n=1 Tax=Agrobacterium sp. 33MFTa1.1 TaxID=1279031 RepID=UPI00055335AA|nr:hypothetical protein [Agrobacterium sp. 33MFTa1.1]QBJ15520.1 hypothetical protein EYD00_18950 [Agrobacterium sp. 33MFTa1.1]
MTAKQDRSNAYLENRLKRDHPNIYADWVAGRYGNVLSAAIAAGLKKPRTRLHELKNAWQKASAQERDEFEKWLLAQSGIKTRHPSSAGAKVPVAIDRRLQPWAKSRIKAIMAMRNLQMGDVMVELGEKRLNPSLGQALHNGSRLRPTLVAALEGWLEKNKHI